MSKILEHFETLTQIPHCSKEADKLLDFLVHFAQKRDYTVEVDEIKIALVFRSQGSHLLYQAGPAAHMQKAQHDHGRTANEHDDHLHHVRHDHGGQAAHEGIGADHGGREQDREPG